MKVVLLAGGLGTRISEESVLKPKPMIEIGDKPILWHIMKIFSYYGFNDFIICCGYKGYLIKEYFYHYMLHNSSVKISLHNNSFEIIDPHNEDWRVTLVDTGIDSMTGGRLKKIHKFLEKDENFFMTYGDGVADININNLLKFHKKMSKIATITAVQPPGRFGALEIEDDLVISFQEKPLGDGGWINGGFFVLNESVINLIDSDNTIWEQEPLKQLAKNKNLAVFKHSGFWQPMDTLRDKNYLEKLWEQRSPPWRIWDRD